MFETLGKRLGGVFEKLRGKGTLSEGDVKAVSREIRIALLEADVALPVVKEFIQRIGEKAEGQNVIKGINPGQQIIKIVNDEIVKLLGGSSDEDREEQRLNFGPAPSAYLMVGLQGSGKTTSTAKIAKYLTDKKGKKVLMASLDVYRPAAQEQLNQLGKQTEIDTLEIIDGQKPLDITKRALKEARNGGYDVVILDTAGRTTLDEKMMAEARAIQKEAKPVETILVADALTGQDAVATAKAFDEAADLTGIMLTRMDGDARGGAAMSMKMVTGKPVKLAGTGEKWTEIEEFDAERVAGRILGMGDVVSLVEKTIDTVDQEEAEKIAAKFRKGQFDFEDLLTQMRQMSKMGGMGSLMKMIPGMSKMSGMMKEAGMDDSFLTKQEALILSMTPEERTNPSLLNASRKRRIATGAGSSVQELNNLVKQQKEMAGVMKRMKKQGMGGMMKQMRGLMGGKMDDLEAMAGDPEALMKELGGMQGGDHGPLGPNPFDQGGGLPPELGGLMPPSHGGSKKNRKKKKKR